SDALSLTNIGQPLTVETPRPADITTVSAPGGLYFAWEAGTYPLPPSNGTWFHASIELHLVDADGDGMADSATGSLTGIYQDGWSCNCFECDDSFRNRPATSITGTVESVPGGVVPELTAAPGWPGEEVLFLSNGTPFRVDPAAEFEPETALVLPAGFGAEQ